MTIATETRRAGPYSGDDSTQVFAFSFKTFSQSDLVVVTTTSGVDTVKTLTTHYTVSLNANQNTSPGGSVTMLTAPATGTTVTILSAREYLQSLNVQNAGAFLPENLNDALDNIVIGLQQVYDELQRLPRGALSDSAMARLPSASLRANGIFGFDASGDPTILSSTAFDSLVALASDIEALADIAASIVIVADADVDVATVAANIGDVGTVATALDDGTIGDLLDGQVGKVATLAALQAYTPVDGQIMYMAGRASAGDGGGGLFRFSTSDLSTEVAADERTVGAGDGDDYIAPSSDDTGASGAWQRIGLEAQGAVRTITVGASGADYTTLQDAIDAIDDRAGRGEFKNTISIAAGSYTMTTQALLRSSRADPIYITGAALVNLSSDFVGVTSITSNGDQDHDIVLEITGHGLSAGDCVLIRDTTGTGAHESFHGFYELDSVTTDTITFNHKGKGASWAAYTVSTMEIYHVPTVLVASGTNILSDYHENRSDDPGLLEGLSGTWRIANIGLLDKSTDADATGVTNAYYGSHVQLYNYVGINGFKRSVRAVGPAPGVDCRNVFVHGASVTGFESQRHSSILAVTCAATGCATAGFRANDGAQLHTSGCTSSMNAYNYICSGGDMNLASSTSNDAGTYDIWDTQRGHIHLQTSFVGDGETRLEDVSNLLIETAATIPTLTVTEDSRVHGASVATITTKTYTLGTVDGIKYENRAQFEAGAVSSVSVSTGTFTDIPFTEITDPYSVYSAGIFTAPVDGYYQFSAACYFDASEASANDASVVISRFVLTGASSGNYRFGSFDPQTTDKVTAYMAKGTDIFYMEAGDTCKVQFYQTSGSTQTANRTKEFWRFSGHRVSAA